MAVSPPSTVVATSIAFRAYAQDLFAGVGQSALFRMLADVLPDGGDYTQQHNILEAMPVIREWVGSRQFPDALLSTVTGIPKTYEKSFKEDRKRADKSSGEVLLQRLTKWLGNPENDLDKIITEYLLSNPIGYDGVALFATNHPRGPADAPTQGNFTTSALSGPQHRAALVAGSSLRDENGEPFNVQYNVLMVGPALAPLARELTGSTRRFALNATGVEAAASVVAATTAPNFGDRQIFDGGDLTVVVNPRFVGAFAQRYLYLDTTKGVMPVAAYRGETQVDERIDPQGDNVFERDEYEWGVRHDLTLLPGAWQVAYLGAP